MKRHTTDLVSLPDHRSARTLVQNDQLRQAVAPFLTRPVEFFKATVGGGVSVDGWMIKPRDFDSTRTYPLLVYVYGEPAGQTTNDSWAGGSALWYRTIADAGYIVRRGAIRVEDGDAEVIAGPGALIGELALIVAMRRPSSAVAIENSTVIRVARSLFQRVLESDPAAARRLRDEIATRTSQLASDIMMAGAKLST